MSFNDFNCPIRYPNKCNLLSEQYESLIDSTKYIAFLMYKFKARGTRYVKDTIDKFFIPDKYRILDAQQEPAVGVKLCKICRLAIAADFGIALLSPLNYNVFFEVGMMLGMGKPVLFILNPNTLPLENVPFDLGQEILITYTSESELKTGLEREVPLFIGSVGKTKEYRETRNVFNSVVYELEINRMFDHLYGSQPPRGQGYLTANLVKLIETENIPSNILAEAVQVYNDFTVMNSYLYSAPVLDVLGGYGKSKLENNWDKIKTRYDSRSSRLKFHIQYWLRETSQMKPQAMMDLSNKD